MYTYSANQLKQCQLTDKNVEKHRYDAHCSRVLRQIEINVGHIEERSYNFPPKLLAYLRKVVLVGGEFRVDSYEASLKEFCMAVDISLCQLRSEIKTYITFVKKTYSFFLVKTTRSVVNPLCAVKASTF